MYIYFIFLFLPLARTSPIQVPLNTTQVPLITVIGKLLPLFNDTCVDSPQKQL